MKLRILITTAVTANAAVIQHGDLTFVSGRYYDEVELHWELHENNQIKVKTPKGVYIDSMQLATNEEVNHYRHNDHFHVDQAPCHFTIDLYATIDDDDDDDDDHGGFGDSEYVGVDIGYDVARYTATYNSPDCVPEPSTAAMFGLVGVGFVLRKKR